MEWRIQLAKQVRKLFAFAAGKGQAEAAYWAMAMIGSRLSPQSGNEPTWLPHGAQKTPADNIRHRTTNGELELRSERDALWADGREVNWGTLKNSNTCNVIFM